MNRPFQFRPDAGSSWVPAGPVSTFPDLGEDLGNLIQARRCDARMRPGCKIFHVPNHDTSPSREIVVPEGGSSESASSGDDLLNQVVVFRYRGKFHAVDHRCPHSAYPLSNGTPFDIEDFGVRLSAGLTCPKHGWSFDLFTGMADTGRYKLPIWEVQLRDGAGVKVVDPSRTDDNVQERTVWIRRKQKMG